MKALLFVQTHKTTLVMFLKVGNIFRVHYGVRLFGRFGLNYEFLTRGSEAEGVGNHLFEPAKLQLQFGAGCDRSVSCPDEA